METGHDDSLDVPLTSSVGAEQEEDCSPYTTATTPAPTVRRKRGLTKAEVKEKAHKTRAWLKRFDKFGFTPVPRAAVGEQISLRGLLGTFLLMALFLAYVGLTTQRFWDDPPAISLENTPTSSAPINLPEVALTFRKNVDGRPLEFMYNESFFKIYYTVTTGFEQDLYKRKGRVHEMVPCDVSSWAGWSGSSALCPIDGEALTLEGRYQASEYGFFGAHVVTCDENYPYKNSTTNLNVPCAPKAEIEEVLIDGRFNLLQNFHTWEGFAFESSWYLYNPLLHMLFEGVYHKYHMTQSPDFLRTWITKEKTVLKLSFEKTLTQKPSPDGAIGGIKAISIYARLDSYEVSEQRQRQNVLDLIGAWEALYGAIFAGMAWYFAKYNEKKFYKANPAWDELGSSPFADRGDGKKKKGETTDQGANKRKDDTDAKSSSSEPVPEVEMNTI